jgi:exo-1,4-beta-D-glucosaminidase
VRLHARVFNMDMTEKFSRDTTLDIPADTSMHVFKLPALAGLSSTYFVDLRLQRGDSTVSSNLYWLSTRPDVLNADSTTWYVTPVKSYADFTALAQLPPAQVRSSMQSTRQGSANVSHVTVTNTSNHLAFFIRLQIKAGPKGAEVLPVTWSDNYVSLLPGETRRLTARYNFSGLKGARPSLVVSGWNVK